MNPDKLNAIAQLLMALAAIVGPLSAAYIARLRARERKECRARGEDTEGDPKIAGAGPLVLLVFGGALLAYLLAQHPELARLPPVMERDELANGSIAVKYCASSEDCAGGTCERGQCVYPKESKPQTGRRRPRVVTELPDGTQCADCPNLPWMISGVAVGGMMRP